MKQIDVLFFGSTSDSLIVLEKLFEEKWNIVAVITQPPRPIGRKQTITSTPTEVWAKEHEITVLSFPNSPESAFLYADETSVINTLETFKADLLISASYGQKIPTEIITQSQYGGLNVHPSLLPRWRGPDPIPWQILSDDHQTGVTVVTITGHMDEGKIVAQKKIPLLETDEREPLRKKLFELGAELLADSLPKFLDGTIKGEPQNLSQVTTARRLTREDGFIPWEIVQTSIKGASIKANDLPEFLRQFVKGTDGATLIYRALHALSPWPGIWTEISIKDGNKKRLKILKAHISNTTLVLDEVQLEGKNPQSYLQFIHVYPV